MRLFPAASHGHRLARCAMALLISLTNLLPMTSLPLAHAATEQTTGEAAPEKSADEKAKEEKEKQAKKLEFTLTEGQKPPEKPAQPVTVAVPQDIPIARAEKILSRLPALIKDKDQPFIIPEQSLVKPDRPGITIEEPFPPKLSTSTPRIERQTPSAVVEPLKVQNVSHEGSVDTLYQLSVTFSEPMVPLAAVNRTIDASQFITLKPQPIGTWKWAGPQTLQFDPAAELGRFPKSTRYQASVPAGVTSIAGGKTAKPFTWEIITPPLSVDEFYPTQFTQPLNPVVIMVFDQEIDHDQTLRSIKVSDGNTTFPMKRVPFEAIKDRAPYYLQNKTDKNLLAFEPKSPLPYNSSIQVTLKTGAPSKEGPLRTTRERSFNFKVHGPLKLVVNPNSLRDVYAGNGPPIELTNRIDVVKFKESMVSVEPKVEDFKVVARDNWFSIAGKFKPLSKYKLTFDATIRDEFGQSLGKSETVTFTTARQYPQIRMAHFATIPHGQKAQFPIYVQGIDSVDVSIFQVKPEDWFEFEQYRYDPSKLNTVGWTLKKKETVKVSEEGIEYDGNLEPYLQDKSGQFVFVVNSNDAEKNRHSRQTAWVQVTGLGIDVFTGKKLTTLTSTLANGRPIEGATVTLATETTETSKSDKDGLSVFSTLDRNTKNSMVIARKESDCVILPRNMSNSDWVYNAEGQSIKWYAVSDRKLYKPGETVSIKGWMRKYTLDKSEAIELSNAGVGVVFYVVRGHDGKELGRGEANVDRLGGFSFETKLPEKVNLGAGYIEIHTRPVEKPGESGFVSALRRDYPGGDSNKSAKIYNSIESTTNVAIDIQEFRRPEFDMKVKSSLGNSMFVGDKTSLTATAKYYTGNALPNAPVNWNASVSQGTYSPPGWSEYGFGNASHFYPWFGTYRSSGGRYGQRNYPHSVLSTNASVSGKTDATGSHTADLQFQSFASGLPISCKCEATVQDVNRQTWSDSATILVHSADVYVGVKQARAFYKEHEPIDLKLIATDLDGKVVVGQPIEVSLLRVTETEVEVDKKKLTSTEQPQTVKLPTSKSGSYKIVVTVHDTKGRINETTVMTYVQGEAMAQSRTVESEKVIVVPSKTEYQPGDIAEIMVNSPFYPAHGILNVRRRYAVTSTPIIVESSSVTFKVPITKELYPNCQIEVFLVGENNAWADGAADLKIPPKARRLAVTATPSTAEVIPNTDTSIAIDLKDSDGKPIFGGQVAVIVADEAHLALAGYKWPDPIEIFYPDAPGRETSDGHSRQFIQLKPEIQEQQQSSYKKFRGKAQGYPGSAALGGGPGRVEPPRDMNLFQVEPTVLDERHFSSGRAERRQKTSPSLPEGAPIPDSSGHDGDANKEISLRADFSPLALFSPAVTTDVNGKAVVRLHLPDTVTRYRIMAAVVAGDDKFGSSEGSVTARLPLTVKPSAPRFLNFGDRCELPVVVQNETDAPLKVEVAMRSENALLQDTERVTDVKLGEEQSEKTPPQKQEIAGKAITIPPRDRVEVRFPVATLREGKAQFQCAAVAGSLSDASQFSLPVLVPASIETFAAYGELDKDSVAQRLDRPTDVFDQVGGLTITTSSTAMQALTDAYFYLYHYPFACSEQLSARLLSMLSLENVLTSFGKLEGADKVEFRRLVERDLEQLLSRQNSNGGFGLWKTNEEHEWPFVTMQVTKALTLAKEKDYAIDQEKLNRARNYIDHISNYLDENYDFRSRLAIQAQALNIRAKLNDVDAPEARKILRKAVSLSTEKLTKQVKELSDVPADLVAKSFSLECAAWLLPVVSKDKNSIAEAEFLRRLIKSQIKETTSTASSNDGGGYGMWDYCMFYSPRRTDAVVLEALMFDEPESPLIPKLVRGLLGHRKNGLWNGTQENGSILQALDKYFGIYEKQTPDFESQMWLGNTLVSLQKFAGRSVVGKEVNVPMSFLKKTDEKEILITKSGPGRLYYRLGLDYAPKSLMLKAADFGFSVERKYEAVEKPDDVKRDADGVYHIKAGAVVRSKITFKAPGARYHVALMDPLPAGAEPLNAELAGTQSMFDKSKDAPEEQEKHRYLFQRSWANHENLRDHQAEAFTSLLGAGTYSYSYLMRATTPGHYRVAPTKAEEMYATETFGRAESENVIIE